MKDQCAASRTKTYNDLIDNGDKNKKINGAGKCIMKLKFKDYKNFLEANHFGYEKTT